jgi:PAS domain S-box-containing protein
MRMAQVGGLPDTKLRRGGPGRWRPAPPDQLFRLLVSAVQDDAIIALDAAGRVLTWNAGARRLYGYEPEQIVGLDVSQLCTAEDRDRRHAQHELRIAAHTGSFHEEGWRVRRDGTRFWASVALNRMDDPTGSLLGFAEITRDITEKRRAHEAELAEQIELAQQRDRLLKDVEFERARFEALVKQMRGAVMVGEAPSGKLVFGNSRIQAVWGHPLIESESVDQYAQGSGFHPDGRPYEPGEWPLARAIQRGEVVDGEEVEILWPGGERRCLRLSAAPVRAADGHILAGLMVGQDVTGEKAAHRRLAQSEARFRSILDNSPALIFVKDVEGRYVVENAALARFIGREDHQIVGRTDFELLPRDLAERLRRNDEEVRHGQAACQVEEVIGDRTYLTVRFPVLNAGGAAQLVGGIATDITDRNRAEAQLRTLTEELERTVAQRTQELVAANKELEAFSYSVSHDLRAPLRAIDGFSKGLVEDHAAQLPPEAHELLSDVRQAAQRMAVLIDDLLRLARLTRAPLTRTRVNLSRLAESVIAELRRGDPGRAVAVHIQSGLTAEGDEPLIRVALENLFANAWKFTARKEHPEIWFGARIVDGTQAFFVRDNGAGFDMTYADKLFVTFQRLHATSEFPGTGIGLATVQRVVRRHGGRAWAIGEPGRGATVSFTLCAGGGTR